MKSEIKEKIIKLFFMAIWVPLKTISFVIAILLLPFYIAIKYDCASIVECLGLILNHIEDKQ